MSVTARDLTYAEVADLDRLRAVLASACDRTEARAIAWLWDSMMSAHGGRPAPAGFVEAVATALGDLLAVHVPGVHWTVWPGPTGPTLGVVSYARPQAPVVLFLDAQDRWNARARDWIVEYLSRAAAHLAGATVPQQRRALDDEATPPYEPVEAPTTDAGETLPVRVAGPVDVAPMPIAPLVPAPATAAQAPDRFAPQGATPVGPPIPVTLLTRASVSVTAPSAAVPMAPPPSAAVPMAPAPVRWEPAAPIADLPAFAPVAGPAPLYGTPEATPVAEPAPVFAAPEAAPTFAAPEAAPVAEPQDVAPEAPVAEPRYMAPVVTPPVAVTLPTRPTVEPAFAAPVFASAPPMTAAAPVAAAPFPVAEPLVAAPTFGTAEATFAPIAPAPVMTAPPSTAPAPAAGAPLEDFALDALDHAMVLLREIGSFDREAFVMLIDADGRRRTETCPGEPGEARFRARELVRSSGAARAAITYVEHNPLELPGPRQTFPAVLVDAFDAGNGGLRVGRRFVDDVLGTGPIGAPLVVGQIARLL